MTLPRDRRSRKQAALDRLELRAVVRDACGKALVLVRLDRALDEHRESEPLGGRGQSVEVREHDALGRQLAEQRIEPVELHRGPVLRRRVHQIDALGGCRPVDRLIAFGRRNVSGPEAATGGSNSGSQARAFSAVSHTAKSSGIGWMRQPNMRGLHGRAQFAAVDGVRIDERVLAEDDKHRASPVRRITVMMDICAVTWPLCAPARAFSPIRSWSAMAARSGRPHAHRSRVIDRSPPRRAAASAACRAGSHSPRATACSGR